MLPGQVEDVESGKPLEAEDLPPDAFDDAGKIKARSEKRIFPGRLLLPVNY